MLRHVDRLSFGLSDIEPGDHTERVRESLSRQYTGEPVSSLLIAQDCEITRRQALYYLGALRLRGEAVCDRARGWRPVG